MYHVIMCVFSCFYRNITKIPNMFYLNNPDISLDYTVDISLSFEEIQRQVDYVLTQIVGSSHTPAHQLSPLVGGLTNVIYKSEAIDCNRNFIIRVYGVGTEAFINRDNENIVFSTFSRSGTGPVFYGRFSNGRVEGYLNASPIDVQQICHPRVANSLSRVVGLLHKSHVDITTSCVIWDQFHRFYSLANGNVI